MWGVFDAPGVGRRPPAASASAITTYLGVAHGWVYMIFVVVAFLLSRRAGWTSASPCVTLVCRH